MKRDSVEQKSFVDPVCGMQVSFKTAAAGSEYRGKRYLDSLLSGETCRIVR
jgi:hypothetical protein